MAVLAIAVILAFQALATVQTYTWAPALLPDSWTEKIVVITLALLTTLVISVFEWDVLFPDHQDLNILGVLPIKTPTIFTAKFFSLILFVSGFSLAILLIPSLAYGVSLNKSTNLTAGAVKAICDLLGGLMGCLTAFFFSGTIQGLFRIFLPRKLYRVTAVLFFLVFATLLFLAIPSGYEIGSEAKILKETNPQKLSFFPPMWFVGFSESLGGNTDPVFQKQILPALGSFLLFLFSFLLLSLFFYRRNMNNDSSLNNKVQYPLIPLKFITRKFFYFLFRSPIQRGIFSFVKHSLIRIAEIRLQIGLFIAFALAFDLLHINSYIRYQEYHKVNLSEPGQKLFILSYVLIFAFLLAIRLILDKPQNLHANWGIELTEQKSKVQYFRGLRKTILLLVALPLNLLIFLAHWPLWGIKNSLIHTLFCLIFSLVLNEILTLRYHKFPFACSYFPDRNKLHFSWVLRGVSFYFFYKTCSSLEFSLFSNYRGILLFSVCSYLFILVLRFFKKKDRPFKFNEGPEDYILSLNLQSPENP